MAPPPEPQRTSQPVARIDGASASLLHLLPDFFAIGPQRTGTTWLWQMLSRHPQVVMTEHKELFYFDTLGNPSHPNHHTDDLGWYLAHFRARHRHRRRLRMLLRRLLGRPWRTIRGEATANYAAMTSERIARAVALQPALRAIMLVRDPLERAWSHAKKDLASERGRDVADVPDAEWYAFFADDYQRRCARYVDHADRWTAALQPGHLLIERFDRIASDPRGLLQVVLEFLGIDASPRILETLPLTQRVNPTAEQPMPARLRQHLDALLAEDREAVAARFGWRW